MYRTNDTMKERLEKWGGTLPQLGDLVHCRSEENELSITAVGDFMMFGAYGHLLDAFDPVPVGEGISLIDDSIMDTVNRFMTISKDVVTSAIMIYKKGNDCSFFLSDPTFNNKVRVENIKYFHQLQQQVRLAMKWELPIDLPKSNK